MKKLIYLLPILVLLQLCLYAQVGIGTATPAASAKLDITSTIQGFLPPRMTTAQRDGISSPAEGLVIFNTSTNGFEYKSNTGWISLKNSTTVNYPSVLIGAQYWMEKNLEVTTYRNGDIIPYVPIYTYNGSYLAGTEWKDLPIGAWCYYNNDPSSGYGKLYNWHAVNDPRGLAPAGWHIPTDAEWTTLTTTLGGESVAGDKMKTTGTTRWLTSNNGTNSSGFAGLPGGLRDSTGTFGSLGSYGYWWSATESSGSNAWNRSLANNNGSLTRANYNKHFGFFVRCIRD